RPPLEPRVEELRARGDDAFMWDAVPLDRLPPLAPGPDEHALRHPLEEALGWQVVPARDQRRRRNPEPPRALQELDLGRGAVDDRCGENDVGGPPAGRAGGRGRA